MKLCGGIRAALALADTDLQCEISEKQQLVLTFSGRLLVLFVYVFIIWDLAVSRRGTPGTRNLKDSINTET
ncbi:Uncharacterized protein DAT39_015161, partial [Clarias magur]